MRTRENRMSILDKLQCIKTGFVSVETGDRKAIAEISMSEPSMVYGTNRDEYIMKVEIGTFFRANQAEYSRAVEEAKKLIAHELYKDVLAEIENIKNMVWSECDKCEIMSELSKLEGELK